MSCVFFILFSSSSAFAKVCDYRPSQIIGGFGSGIILGASASGAGAGLAVKSAGFYTLTHAATGATMLGSAAGGASAAGTVGIMGGTAGVVGTTAAVIMSPVFIIGTAIVGIGVAGYEGACYFTDERITDKETILLIMRDLDSKSDPEYFQLISEGDDHSIKVKMLDEMKVFKVENLFIENGVLKNDDWFKNTVIGKVDYQTIVPATTKD